MAEHFNGLVERLDLPGDVTLPRAKANAPCDYRTHYDDEAKSIVRRLHVGDFERFGHEF